MYENDLSLQLHYWLNYIEGDLHRTPSLMTITEKDFLILEFLTNFTLPFIKKIIVTFKDTSILNSTYFQMGRNS